MPVPGGTGATTTDHADRHLRATTYGYDSDHHRGRGYAEDDPGFVDQEMDLGGWKLHAHSR